MLCANLPKPKSWWWDARGLLTQLLMRSPTHPLGVVDPAFDAESKPTIFHSSHLPWASGRFGVSTKSYVKPPPPNHPPRLQTKNFNFLADLDSASKVWFWQLWTRNQKLGQQPFPHPLPPTSGQVGFAIYRPTRVDRSVVSGDQKLGQPFTAHVLKLKWLRS